MPDNKSTSWVHGSAMQVEYLARITSVRHTGQNTWVHFPIPTPTFQNGSKTTAKSALLSFRTRSHATVNEIIVYDGEKRIAEHMDIDLQGDHLNGKFDIPGNPEITFGLNITVGVTFDQGAPDTRSMQIEIIGAGIEFGN